MKPTEILRWATVLLFGGFGSYLVGGVLWHTWQHFDRDWVLAAFTLGSVLIFAGLPLAVACLAYFRRYRRLAQIGQVICTLLLLGELSQLVNWLEGDSLTREPGQGPGWHGPFFLLLMLSSWWAVGAFVKYSTRMVDRYLPEPEPTEAQQARALRWERRIQPVRRGLLRAAMAGAELLVWAAVLVFVGTLAWLWQASGGLDGADDVGRNTFGLGLAVMAGCLLVFLVSLMARSDCRNQLRGWSAAND